jgi:hypothetical protein
MVRRDLSNSLGGSVKNRPGQHTATSVASRGFAGERRAPRPPVAPPGSFHSPAGLRSAEPSLASLARTPLAYPRRSLRSRLAARVSSFAPLTPPARSFRGLTAFGLAPPARSSGGLPPVGRPPDVQGRPVQRPDPGGERNVPLESVRTCRARYSSHISHENIVISVLEI